MLHSPYRFGAGKRPPYLAGRDSLLATWRLMLDDVLETGRGAAVDTLITGPRGVGKTVVLETFADLARDRGYEVVSLQAAAHNPTLVASLLTEGKARATPDNAWAHARHAFDELASVSVTIAGTGVAVARQAGQMALATPESVARALAAVADNVVRNRHDGDGGLLLTIDELQVAAPGDLALLAAALQRLTTAHASSHVLFAAAGLPNTPDALSHAGVTHPDRLLDLTPLPLSLQPVDAREALAQPAQALGVHWQSAAAQAIVDVTHAYPAHLQLFADATWKAAPEGTESLTPEHAREGVTQGTAAVERRTFTPRLNQLPDRQAEFLTALAYLSGDAPTRLVANALGRATSDLSVVRQQCIDDGDIWAPRRGFITLTQPLFGAYLVAHYPEVLQRSELQLSTLPEIERRLHAPHDLPSDSE